LLDLTYYENLDEFFEKNKDGSFFFFTTKARQTHSDVNYPDKSYLLFGKETKGLPEELLLKHPDECVRIPMIDDARSLNLSNSVAIGVYEALRQLGYPELSNQGQLHNYKW
jgi:tRNA (cytidine/uridine-2'-O-)-methyltransferase